ncbi:MAG TPA: cyclic nucleotide-binding domain-containing protein [Terriglobia bacterium]|nr:cyclic nucleotide-binding domain-containing protein [Terriglobia bacterium]
MRSGGFLDVYKEEKRPQFETLFGGISVGKRILHYSRNQTVFTQGDEAAAVYYILQGQVRVTVVSFAGKEATLSVMGPQEFVGMECLSGQCQRLGTASTLEPSELIRIEKNVMLQALREQPQLFDFFLSRLLNHNLSLQKDLCTQIFDPSERRLMRVLLKLSRFGQPCDECVQLRKISHDTLATMVGTTRSRVTYFMNKFKKMGVVGYGKGIQFDPSRLSHVLQED